MFQFSLRLFGALLQIFRCLGKIHELEYMYMQNGVILCGKCGNQSEIEGISFLG